MQDRSPPPPLARRPLYAIRTLLRSEAAGGVILVAVAAAALGIANSPFGPAYFAALHTKVAGLSVLHWVNDALMAVFFLMVGLEIKREIVDGELSSWRRRALPGIAALGGMIVPALIYAWVNRDSSEALRGWAIPAATDIAFALGILALLGSRVPVSLRIFLTALAILDDLGAVLIIALGYTTGLSAPMLGLAALGLAGLVALNRLGVRHLLPYLVLGLGVWGAVLLSGVHATVAGVLVALTIPLQRTPAAPETLDSPLHRLEHRLQPWVAYFIVPVFGFANAGVGLSGGGSGLTGTVPLGVALGLFLGKQAGVMLFSALAIRTRLAQLPAHATWAQFYGVALLCGIGFTMSLFIGALAFPAHPELADAAKLGVLSGSAISALAGFAMLRLTSRPCPA